MSTVTEISRVQHEFQFLTKRTLTTNFNKIIIKMKNSSYLK